jgi:Terpene cyclase DEP1
VTQLQLERTYLVLFVLGTVLPLVQVVPWLTTHGLDIQAFFGEAFAGRVSSAFAWDVIVSALVVLVFGFFDARLRTTQRALVAVCTVLVGVSCGLPLALWLRVRQSSSAHAEGAPQPGQ